MQLRLSSINILFVLIVFIEALTPIKYLVSTDFLQYRNIVLAVLTVMLLPVKFDKKNLIFLFVINIGLLVNLLVKVTFGYNFSILRFINEFAALNMIFYIILFSVRKHFENTSDTFGRLLITLSLLIFLLNALLAIYFASKGIRTHSGELILPFLLYYSLHGRSKIFRSIFTSFVSILGNSRGFGLSILTAYVASTHILLKFFFVGLFSYFIYAAASEGLIRNVNFDNLTLGLTQFLNIATSGRINEIVILYKDWYDPIFGNGIGIIFNNLNERYWSHSFVFNILYKTGYVGLFVSALVFIIYLKPKNRSQYAYLIGIFLYCNLDFSILLNPLWVYFYRKLTN